MDKDFTVAIRMRDEELEAEKKVEAQDAVPRNFSSSLSRSCRSKRQGTSRAFSSMSENVRRYHWQDSQNEASE